MKKLLCLLLTLLICCGVFAACAPAESGKDDDFDGDPAVELTKYVQQSEIPTLKITAEAEIASKYDYVDAQFAMESQSGDYDFAAGGEIRLRGNYTMTHDKKPYRIKFSEKQTPIGMDSSKSWYLLAETTDFSLMRNYLGYTYADDLLDYSLRARYVHVELNGEYRGLYLMTDKRGEGKNLVPIELTEDVDTGWMIEIDNRAIGGDLPANQTPYEYCRAEGIVFGVNAFYVTFPGNDIQACVISEPEEPTSEQFEAIVQYMSRFARSLGDGTFADYMDLDSMARYYMVKELWHDTDVGSVYLYRESADQKAKMGPVWDLDLTLGNSKIFSAGKQNTYDEWYYHEINCVYRPVFSTKVFQDALKANWQQTYGEQTADLIEGIDQVTDFLAEAQEKNFRRWDTIGRGIYIDGELDSTHFMSDAYLAMKTWEEHAAAVREFLTKRIQWLNENLK